MFDIDFLPITCFNEEYKVSIYKDQLTLVGGSIFYYFASIGINQFEIASLLSYENELGIKDMLKAPESTYTKSDKGGAGKPEKDDDEKADSTLTQKDNGVDKSRAVV